MLETLEGYQEEKDNPRKQVVYMKAEELYAALLSRYIPPQTRSDVVYRFKARFKSLIDQYELRELHFHSAMRTKEIEVQWNMARYEEQKKAAEGEARRANQLNSQVLTFTKTETELRNQLNVYVEKFKQVCVVSFFNTMLPHHPLSLSQWAVTINITPNPLQDGKLGV